MKTRLASNSQSSPYVPRARVKLYFTNFLFCVFFLKKHHEEWPESSWQCPCFLLPLQPNKEWLCGPQVPIWKSFCWRSGLQTLVAQPLLGSIGEPDTEWLPARSKQELQLPQTEDTWHTKEKLPGPFWFWWLRALRQPAQHSLCRIQQRRRLQLPQVRQLLSGERRGQLPCSWHDQAEHLLPCLAPKGPKASGTENRPWNISFASENWWCWGGPHSRVAGPLRGPVFCEKERAGRLRCLLPFLISTPPPAGPQILWGRFPMAATCRPIRTLHRGSVQVLTVHWFVWRRHSFLCHGKDRWEFACSVNGRNPLRGFQTKQTAGEENNAVYKWLEAQDIGKCPWAAWNRAEKRVPAGWAGSQIHVFALKKERKREKTKAVCK